jgi:hypothetical protein
MRTENLRSLSQVKFNFKFKEVEFVCVFYDVGVDMLITEGIFLGFTLKAAESF